MDILQISGVPPSLRNDARWQEVDGRTGATAPPWRRPVLAFLALLVAGDMLLWGYRPGLSLVLFTLLVGMATFVGARPVDQRSPALAALTLGVVPAIEMVQPLSLIFLVLGLLLSAAIVSVKKVQPGPLLRAISALLLAVPGRAVRDGIGAVRDLSDDGGLDGLRERAVRRWALPAVMGVVFVALFAAANPVIDIALDALVGNLPDYLPRPARILFWGVMAGAIWPFLTLRLLRAARQTSRTPHRSPPQMPDWLNAGSVLNSMVVFNVLFAVQTALDFRILWAGGDLPEGMTHARYAHRGAYPLVATALLAAGFALTARPFAHQSRAIGILLGLWLVQNLMLVLSSVLRLSIYVDAYGMTTLRMATFIWMGLVLAGLALTLVQLARGKSNRWLLGWNTCALALVLYLCCFVNFAALILDHNLQRLRQTGKFDSDYNCALAVDAPTSLRAHVQAGGSPVCGDTHWQPRITNWREWGFRDWRRDRYLALQSILVEADAEDPDRR